MDAYKTHLDQIQQVRNLMSQFQNHELELELIKAGFEVKEACVETNWLGYLTQLKKEARIQISALVFRRGAYFNTKCVILK